MGVWYYGSVAVVNERATWELRITPARKEAPQGQKTLRGLRLP
jgi:hypothetical protein